MDEIKITSQIRGFFLWLTELWIDSSQMEINDLASMNSTYFKIN